MNMPTSNAGMEIVSARMAASIPCPGEKSRDLEVIRREYHQAAHEDVGRENEKQTSKKKDKKGKKK